MNTLREKLTSQPDRTTSAETIRRILLQPTNGIVGLVDELLEVSMKISHQMDWQADRCRVRFFDGDWKESIDVPMRKSVFRAILARIAALCNEQTSVAISPYGGQGDLSVGANSARLRVAFVNTPEIQKLELMVKSGTGVE